MSSDSEDDERLDDDAKHLAGVIRQAKTPAKTAAGYQRSLDIHLDEQALPPKLDTTALELSLKQQAAVIIEQRHQEIEHYHTQLNGALAEVARIRTAEEARLAQRIAAAQEALDARIAELQQAFQAYVSTLREESEAAVAQRIRALSSAISPASSPSRAAAAAAAVVTPISRAAGFNRMMTSASRSPAAASPDKELPAFLQPQPAAGSPGTFLTAGIWGHTTGTVHASPLTTTSRSHTHLGPAGLRVGSISPVGLHRTEPKVLTLLGGDSDEDTS